MTGKLHFNLEIRLEQGGGWYRAEAYFEDQLFETMGPFLTAVARERQIAELMSILEEKFTLTVTRLGN